MWEHSKKRRCTGRHYKNNAKLIKDNNNYFKTIIASSNYSLQKWLEHSLGFNLFQSNINYFGN